MRKGCCAPQANATIPQVLPLWIIVHDYPHRNWPPMRAKNAQGYNVPGLHQPLAQTEGLGRGVLG